MCFKQAGTTLLFSALVIPLICTNYYRNCYISFLNMDTLRQYAFSEARVAQYSVFCVVFCRSLCFLLSFLFLCSLSFYLSLLVTLLVYSIFSCI